MTELLFAKEMKKPECQELLSENGIPFDPKAGVNILRDLLIANELALAPEPEADEKVTIIGEAHHRCEMAGQVIEFKPKDELKLDAWKAEKLVGFGVARYK